MDKELEQLKEKAAAVGTKRKAPVPAEGVQDLTGDDKRRPKKKAAAGSSSSS